jgi:hypothetical protein
VHEEAADMTVYDVVVLTLTRVPYVVAIMVAVVLSYLAYRRRRGRRSEGRGPPSSRCLRYTDSWPRWRPLDGTSRSCY